MAGLALTTDTSVLTASGTTTASRRSLPNRSGPWAAGGCPGGNLSSGSSPNIVRAIEVAREMGIKTMDSRCRRVIRDMVDCAVCIPSNSTPRIQEAHILVEHILCEILEEAFS